MRRWSYIAGLERDKKYRNDGYWSKYREPRQRGYYFLRAGVPVKFFEKEIK